MSEQTPLEKVKYGLLKIIDVSGFRVFDPVVRLFFGEEPKKQLGDITRFMLMPIVFVCCCLLLWNFIAPRHKTKSGEVPTPSQVWGALVVNNTIHNREKEKQSDFLLSSEQTETRVTEIETLIKEKEAKLVELKESYAKIKTDSEAEIAKSIAPMQLEYDELRTTHKAARKTRKEEAIKLSEAIAKKTANPEELLAHLRVDAALTKQEKAAEKALKTPISELRSNKPKNVKTAELAVDSAATEIQHLRKRLEFLGISNRGNKVAEAKLAATDAVDQLKSADESAAILAAAKTVVKGEEKAANIAEQKYAKASTIWYLTWRSLFTVCIGFFLAAAVAIPFGIMCGLNRVVMACLTPIISVFKPVSPVVWLVIFQIIIGAFFPAPKTHPFFVFLNELPFLEELKVNPAMIFSACTVAMCALWPALVNTALGVSSVEQDHINVAKVLKLGLWARLTKIIIPSSLPLVFAGLRISLGVGWMVLIAAEALSGSKGLGTFVWDEYQNGSSYTFSNILLACFLIGIIGFFLDRLMIVLQRSVSFEDGAAVV